MRLLTKTPEFEPITIQLETLAEVQSMWSLVANTCSSNYSPTVIKVRSDFIDCIKPTIHLHGAGK